jgi:DNA modification methylase
VWEISPASATRVLHPAPFSVELLKRFIELYTLRNEWVLDPFMGSGTTAVAPTVMARMWIGYDVAPFVRARIHNLRL